MDAQYIRGSTYTLAIPVRSGGIPIEPKIVDEIVFSFDNIHKSFPQDATYDEKIQKYIVRLNREDTLSLKKTFKFQVEVHYNNVTKDIGQTLIQYIDIEQTLNGEAIYE